MFNYLIVHLYALLVFISVIVFLRILFGKVEKREEKNTGKASGIVGLEVTEISLPRD